MDPPLQKSKIKNQKSKIKKNWTNFEGN